MKKFMNSKKGKIITGTVLTIGILLIISVPVTAEVQNKLNRQGIVNEQNKLNQPDKVNKQNKLNQPVIVNEQNRDMIGEETQDNYILKYQDGKYVDSDGNKYSEAELSNKIQKTIPNNPIVKQIKMENFVPSSIVEFETKESNGVFNSPEIITINGSLSVLTKINGEGWDLKPNEKVSFSFEKYKSKVVDSQKLIVGLIKNGTLNNGDIFDKIEGKYEFTVSEPGIYYIYFVNASSESITLKNGHVLISNH
ncbi:hypothetical protein [Paenibacillus cellulositrophicus]|uniref:hypothetical protein n=1 Tax=Paenibacillus cellulositrophicus TaxID=562959 RepID=UPI0012671801|nr:hypothetical protein [Paenibacillus cellulositrophicus]